VVKLSEISKRELFQLLQSKSREVKELKSKKVPNPYVILQLNQARERIAELENDLNQKQRELNSWQDKFADMAYSYSLSASESKKIKGKAKTNKEVS